MRWGLGSVPEGKELGLKDITIYAGKAQVAGEEFWQPTLSCKQLSGYQTSPSATEQVVILGGPWCATQRIHTSPSAPPPHKKKVGSLANERAISSDVML